jgi:hypothetical protein
MRTATPPWPLRAAKISVGPHIEARARAADWKYDPDRLRKRTIARRAGSRRVVEIVGNNRGRRGKVVRMNVAIKRSNDHRICLVGLDCHQLSSPCSLLFALSSLLSPLCSFFFALCSPPFALLSLLFPFCFLLFVLSSLLSPLCSPLSPPAPCVSSMLSLVQ